MYIETWARMIGPPCPANMPASFILLTMSVVEGLHLALSMKLIITTTT
jgi:hypothetical protein